MKVSATTKRLALAAAAVSLSCALAACASGPGKSDAQREADRATTERVEAALGSDRQLYAKHISVRADNGVVYLTGFVWDRPDFDQATFVAEGVQGVTRVVNDLEFQQSGSDNNAIAR